MKPVLVLGGSGALGQALLRELSLCETSACFTFLDETDTAQSLQAELGFPAYQVDLRRPTAIPELFVQLEAEQRLPRAVVHCAGIAPNCLLQEISIQSWDELHAIHGRAALQVAQQMQQQKLQGSLVLVAALDGILPVPAPAHYAASQAALWGLTQALAKELAPQGILVNLAVLGVLDNGISAELAPRLRDSYQRYAAMARTGTCVEAAQALRWLALENTYMNGAQLPISGGLG
jgi:3-oxoacyl-[acyl-carrier protein] reductase